LGVINIPQLLQVGALAAMVRAVKLAREDDCGGSGLFVAGETATGCGAVAGMDGPAITSPLV
jgi:hypothetical protein